MNNAGDSPSASSRFLADSLDAVNVEMVEGRVDTMPRPVTPEHIAAMKRYYERMGRKPPPPYDKL